MHNIIKKLDVPQHSKGPVGSFRKTFTVNFLTWQPGGIIYSKWFGPVRWCFALNVFSNMLSRHTGRFFAVNNTHRKAFGARAIDISSFNAALTKVPSHHHGAKIAHACGTHFANDALSYYLMDYPICVPFAIRQIVWNTDCCRAQLFPPNVSMYLGSMT